MRHLNARIFPSMILQQTTPEPWGRIVLDRRGVAAFHTEYFT